MAAASVPRSFGARTAAATGRRRRSSTAPAAPARACTCDLRGPGSGSTSSWSGRSEHGARRRQPRVPDPDLMDGSAVPTSPELGTSPPHAVLAIGRPLWEPGPPCRSQLGEGTRPPSRIRYVHPMGRGVALVYGREWWDRGCGGAGCCGRGWAVWLTYRVTMPPRPRSWRRSRQPVGRPGCAPTTRSRPTCCWVRGRRRDGTLDALVANAGLRARWLGSTSRPSIVSIGSWPSRAGTIVCCREAVRRFSTLHGGSGGAIVLMGSASSGSGFRRVRGLRRVQGASTRWASGSPGRWRPRVAVTLCGRVGRHRDPCPGGRTRPRREAGR